jgi:hypothetical protein
MELLSGDKCDGSVIQTSHLYLVLRSTDACIFISTSSHALLVWCLGMGDSFYNIRYRAKEQNFALILASDK